MKNIQILIDSWINGFKLDLVYILAKEIAGYSKKTV
jgi:hypothetical protein